MLWLYFAAHLACLPLLVLSGVTYDGCKFELEDTRGMLAEYDLSSFTRYDETFIVEDKDEPKYSYIFDICGAINPLVFTSNSSIPNSCRDTTNQHRPCLDPEQCLAGNDVYEPTAGRTPSAIQVDSEDGTCYWLGMEIETSTSDFPEYNMELLDADNAGKGVTFTILNGEWCADKGRNRELRIHLECPDEQRASFDPFIHLEEISNSTITETDSCIYELNLISQQACPSSCVQRFDSEVYSVCSTHGICASDAWGRGPENAPNGKIHCLCDDGYRGDRCEEKYDDFLLVDTSHPGLLTAIIICIVLLGIVIVCAAVLCHMIRMKELEDRRILAPLSGGMLDDENDATLAQTKAGAMTMNIGLESAPRSSGASGSQVRLQTMEDQMEKDKVSELLGVESSFGTALATGSAGTADSEEQGVEQDVEQTTADDEDHQGNDVAGDTQVPGDNQTQEEE